MRDDLIALLKTIIPNTYGIGEWNGRVMDNILLIRKDSFLPSVNCNLAGWQQWTVQVYTSKGLHELDVICEQIKNILLNNGFEITNIINGDFYNRSLQAYVSSISFKYPITIN